MKRSLGCLIVLILMSLAMARGGVYRTNLHLVYSAVKVSQGTAVLLDPGARYAIPTLKGMVTLDCAWLVGLATPAPPATGSVQIELAIDGKKTGNYFWGPPCTRSLDTTKIADGTHTLSWYIVDSNGATYSADQLREFSETVVVMNVGPLSLGQTVASAGDLNHGSMVLGGTDFVVYPGFPQHAQVIPYPYSFVPKNLSQPRTTNNWFVDSLNETRNVTYAGDPQFYATKTGGVIFRQFTPSFGVSSSQAWKSGVKFHQNYDGGRGDNRISPYSAIVELPDGSGWSGVELNGRMWMVDHTGKVDTCAGPQAKRDVLQYDFRDKTITSAQLAAKTNFVGTGDTRMAGVTDLTFDKRNPYIVYEADNLDHRILRVDLSVEPPIFSNYAGVYGSAGNNDGPAQQAKFNRPFSLIAAPDGTLYISDFGNGAIRKVSPDGLTVSTLVGGGQPSMAYVAANRAVYAPMGTVSFAKATITYPEGLRMDSKGRLVLIEDATQAVRIIDPVAQTVTTIAMSPSTNSTESWDWLDVDTVGAIGPQDDILVVLPVSGFKPVGGGLGATNLWTVWRLAEDGSYVGAMSWNGNQSGGYAPLVQQAVNHYPWAVAISKFEGKFITDGFSSDGVSEFRVLQATDPTGPMDYGKFTRGSRSYHRGTVVGFPADARPSLTILDGRSVGGHSGVVPNIDALNKMYPAPVGSCTNLTQEDGLAGFIQSGFGGAFPRPEFTGNDLRDLVYYLRRSSLQYGETGNYKPCPDQTDTVAPVVSNVVVNRTGSTTATVQWTTNKASLGFVAFGSTVYYSGGSDLETSYGTVHFASLHDLPTAQPLHFAVVAKDLAGNQSNSSDGTF